jgi:tetratricopeptide (TPR) repeat protein
MGFHAANVAIHAANALLVYALLLRLARREPALAGRERLVAWAGAALFALDPVQTEAITYVSGRSTSLAAFFALASLVVWLAGRERGHSWWAYGASPALFAAGLGVKETVIVLPAALVLTGDGTRTTWRNSGIGPHLGVAAVAVVAAATSPTYRHLARVSLDTRSLGSNLLSQAQAIPYLAVQSVRPDRLNADPALPVAAAWSPAAIVAGVAIVAAIGVGLRALGRRPAIAFGVLWFFLWLAPTNSVLPRLDVVNDRQVYVALIGPAWLVAWGACRMPWDRRALTAAIVVAAVALGTATWRRNDVYRSEVAFWEDVARKAPHNGRAFNNLGYAYALAARDGDAEEALRRALELDPTDVRAAVNLRLLREGALAGGAPHP